MAKSERTDVILNFTRPSYRLAYMKSLTSPKGPGKPATFREALKIVYGRRR